MLEVRDLEVRYGEFHAVHGVSFKVEKGQLITIIGANGAGKTSFLRTVMGWQTAYQGVISWKGRDITRRSAHERASPSFLVTSHHIP